jgi:hypothetical protein
VSTKPASLSPAINYRLCCFYWRFIIAGVFDTTDQFDCHCHGMDENPRQRHRQKIIAGNNDTDDNLSPVSFTPVNTGDKHKVGNIVKIWNTPTMGYSGARGKLIPEKKLKWKSSCQTPFKSFCL